MDKFHPIFCNRSASCIVYISERPFKKDRGGDYDMIKEKTTLELIYEKYRNRMYMAAYRIVKNPTVAEDVLHDTFVALSKNTEKLKNVDSLYTASYVTKAARNHALNTIKKAQQSNIVSIEEIDIVSDESVSGLKYD